MENGIIKKIRTTSYTGLAGSMLLAMATIVFYYACHYRFYMDNKSYQYFLIAGIVIAISFLLLTNTGRRKRMNTLRSLPDTESKLKQYLSHVKTVYWGSLIATTAECAIIVLSNNNTLIMVILILVMLLVVEFPNMYKIKADLGLTDDEMASLFGSDYIRGNEVDNNVSHENE